MSTTILAKFATGGSIPLFPFKLIVALVVLLTPVLGLVVDALGDRDSRMFRASSAAGKPRMFEGAMQPCSTEPKPKPSSLSPDSETAEPQNR